MQPAMIERPDWNPQSLVPQHTQPERYERRRRYAVRLMDTIRFVSACARRVPRHSLEQPASEERSEQASGSAACDDEATGAAGLLRAFRAKPEDKSAARHNR